MPINKRQSIEYKMRAKSEADIKNQIFSSIESGQVIVGLKIESGQVIVGSKNIERL